MNIKIKYINALRDHFIYNSEIYKTSKKRTSELCNEMTNMIISESLKDITKEELNILNNISDFWTDTYIYFGKSFRTKYGGKKPIEEEGTERFYYGDYYVKIKVPKLFLESSTNLFNLSSNILDDLIKLNDEIISIDGEISKIIQSWERLINKDTSKTWLKKNFPEIYEKLREIEDDISI